MTVRDPLYMHPSGGAPDYSAADDRLGFSALLAPGSRLLGARSGVVPAAGDPLLVTHDGLTPGSVSVAAGQAWVDATLSVGAYQLTLETAEVHNVPAAGAVERVDRVVFRARDGEIDGSVTPTDRVGATEYLPGDSGTGAAQPVPTHAVLLAEVTVPTASTPSVEDKRTYQARAGVPLWVNDETARDALTVVPGLMVHRLDTGVNETWTGSAWRSMLPAVEKLDEQTLGAAAGSVTFLVPAGFTRLQVVGTGGTNGGQRGVFVELNGQASGYSYMNNYRSHDGTSGSTSDGSSGATGSAANAIIAHWRGSSQNTLCVDIFDAGPGTPNASGQSVFSARAGTVGDTGHAGFDSNVASVSQVRVGTFVDQFRAGSRFVLYGYR